MQEDEKIIELIQKKGDMELGFQLLMRSYQERIYWQIRRLVTGHDDANDVLQNTFIKIYKGIGKFKGEAKLYTWIYRIAVNESLNFIRKRKKMQGVSIDEEDLNLAERLKSDPYFEGDEVEIKFQEALNRLPEKQKAVFSLRYYDEMPYQEMSQVLGTSIGALKASYHHAIKKMEEYLKEKV
jgi:RNA polymerase sigma-70 factor (ECF subfamily)